MKKKTLKSAALVAMFGCCFQLLGCGILNNLGDIFGSGWVLDAARSAVWEFIWDNDSTLDFFGDTAPGLIS